MNKQTFLIIILILAFGATLYVWLGYRRFTPPTVETTDGKEELGIRLSEFRRLREIKFDTSVFQDKFFQSLKTAPQSIPEEKSGRPNPFIPF